MYHKIKIIAFVLLQYIVNLIERIVVGKLEKKEKGIRKKKKKSKNSLSTKFHNKCP